MSIEWQWNNEDEYLGEYLPSDTLDRGKYAKYLYEVCSSRGENSNLVININAQWGAGKTYFTKRFAKTISNSHPTVYIDAWKDDFSDDPLLTVFSSIKEQLTEQSDKFTKVINKTIENIGPLLKTATPIIIESLVKTHLGIDSISNLSKSLSEKLLDIHAEKNKKVQTIKLGIGEWIKHIKQKDGINKKLPLFIIIDELDRCRPDFSISLLEITKHIFNIPGVVFIISTDTQQLQHSIKVLYGRDFSASHYLSRFFDRRFLLPSPQFQDLLLTKTGENIISDFDSLRKKLMPMPPDINSFISNCSSILQSMSMSLRDAIKIYERLIDILITTEKSFDPNLMLMLSTLNFKDYDLYSRIKSKEKITTAASNASIKLSFDLSYAATQVKYLQHKGNYHNNSYNKKEISTGIINYIETAWNILTMIKVAPPGSHHLDTPEQWLEGYLTADETLVNFLKMGYALRRLE
ncbi:TPA: NTPase KAP, partial [Escherichia coli]|nr:NTPase KAP [Escherichia coli]